MVMVMVMVTVMVKGTGAGAGAGVLRAVMEEGKSMLATARTSALK